MLSDFGISRLLINSKTLVGSTSLRGNMRWMAPELIMPVEGDELEHSCHTKATDVWAFGMVVYVCSEKLHLRWRLTDDVVRRHCRGMYRITRTDEKHR